MPDLPSNLKLLLIGNSSVGKSSLLLRFTDDDFISEEETAATIGVDFKVKSIELDGRKYRLSIWDTAGQERFRTLTSSYYRGAQGVVLDSDPEAVLAEMGDDLHALNPVVYDTTSRATFDELLKWFKEIDTYCSEGVVKMVVGNKVDKEFSRQVSAEEGGAFAERMGTLFIECSAKTKVGVEEAFKELVARILDEPRLWSKVQAKSTKRQEVVVLDDEEAGWGSGCSC